MSFLLKNDLKKTANLFQPNQISQEIVHKRHLSRQENGIGHLIQMEKTGNASLRKKLTGNNSHSQLPRNETKKIKSEYKQNKPLNYFNLQEEEKMEAFKRHSNQQVKFNLKKKVENQLKFAHKINYSQEASASLSNNGFFKLGH